MVFNKPQYFSSEITRTAFGSQRVAYSQTLLDVKQSEIEAALMMNGKVISGSGATFAWNRNLAATVLQVSANTAAHIVWQTNQRANYQPGKGHLVEFTGILGAPKPGITAIAGYFHQDDGLFYRIAPDGAEIVLRSSTSGSPVERVWAQTDWNINRLDGSEYGGFTLDFDKEQIMVIDFQYLGVGRVRYGFNINGMLVYVHEVNNANNTTAPYMRTPNLPVRFELINDGTGASASLQQVCLSVQSEGGQEDTGIVRSVNTGATRLSLPSAGTRYAVLGVRLKSDCLGVTIKTLEVSLQSASNDDFLWELIYNPTVAGTFTYVDEPLSAIQAARGTSANTVTGGVVINSGYGSKEVTTANELKNSLNIGSTVDGVSDQLVLCVTPLSAGASLSAAAAYRELS